MADKILLVEDDARIRQALKMALEDEGFDVDDAASGEDALERTSPADVVLLDLLLPGVDGFEVCRALRRTSDVPIIMVTARADTYDVVAGLAAGADDYVTKPFEVKELVARVRALLRRVHASGSPASSAPRRFGDIDVLPDAGIVRRAGEEISLTKTEFRLLSELARNAGMVLSREQLLEQVWGYDYLGDGRLVDAHIRRLRTKIEADPSNPQHLLTVRGLGYRLVT